MAQLMAPKAAPAMPMAWEGGVLGQFIDVPAKALPQKLRLIVGEASVVRSLQNEIRKQLFQGSLDEIGAVLGREALRSGQPALILSGSGARYSVALASKKSCVEGGKKGFFVNSITSAYLANQPDMKREYCQPE